MFDRDNFERIVIRMPNWVGDVVMATPALRAVRQCWPQAEITVLCLPSGEEILRGSPCIDRFEVYARKGGDRGIHGRRRVIRQLRENRHDLAIALPNSFSSAWIFFRARIPRRLGTAYGKRGWLLTDRYTPELEGQHRVPKSMVTHYYDVLETIDVPRGRGDLELFETDDGRRLTLEKLALLGAKEDDRYVAIVPGAAFGPTKRWPADRFAQVADHLQNEHGLKPLLIGGPGEESLLLDVDRAMKTEALSTADDVFDLDALKTAVRMCSLMVTTDTGPRHYAVAMGVPVVVVMGSTDPRYTESNTEKTTVIREDLDCSPCHLKTCPLSHHHCMTLIEPERVIAACESRLSPPVQ
jgi:heptosyltransferase-2